MLIFRESIKAWDPPYEREPIGPEDVERIIGRVRRVFDLDGYPVEVTDPNQKPDYASLIESMERGRRAGKKVSLVWESSAPPPPELRPYLDER